LRILGTSLGLLPLLIAAGGCFGPPEVDQLRALNDELQRRNVELTVQKLKLEGEIDRLEAEKRKLEKQLQAAGEKTP
jgi:hypothetical protein